MEVEVVVEIKPTEDLEKVKKALNNVFIASNLSLERRGDVTIMIARAGSYVALTKLRQLIFRQGIQDSARSVLVRGIISDDTMVFHLNKQAAYVGVASFITEPTSESPLGPITFRIKSKNLRQLIDWLAPRTYRGKVVYEAPSPED